jgi:hypothetical protein
MKKILFGFFTAALSLSAVCAFSQNVAINEDGSAPNPNAILDVKSFTKGVLIPRVSTTGRLAIPNTKGLLVYDTTVNSFWYNTGAGWQSFATGSDFWSLHGNNGTDSASFLGTSNNMPLIIKVNNQPAGRIDAQSPNNTAWGFNAGGVSSSGEPNTAIGAYSMQSNTTGGYNTAVGTNSLQSNTDGAFNTAIGVGSMSLAKGNNNTAIGAYTLQHNTTGFYNMAFGGGALEANTTGTGNIAIGYESLFWDTSGQQNTAVGLFSMQQNTTGSFNTASGAQTLDNNTTGGSNTAIGAIALSRNTIGNANVAMGVSSLSGNTTGGGNTAIGHSSMDRNTTGENNIALGIASMGTNTTGSQNTTIGAAADVSTGNLSNATAIGAGANVNASNKVRIGNGAVTVIEGQVPFTTPSDGRFKYHIQEDVKGLDFILQLRPVTYQFDVKRFDQQKGAPFGNDQATPVNYVQQASYDEAAAIRRSGFIAQEVEKAAGASGYNFSGVIKPKTAQEHYSLSYESFVVPLVKAMQEQQKIIADLQKQIDELKQQRSK